jgi:predicted ATP-grasp superfamily ATP-dependent carboligase
VAAGRVLVTDADERSAVATCRALAAAGYEVTAGSSRRPSPSAWSRAVARRLHLPDPRLDEAAFVDALERELRATRHDVLLCTTDAAALAVSSRRERLDGLCRHGLPEDGTLARCLDKASLLEAAAAAALDAPESALCSTAEEAGATAAEFGYPVAVKPRRSVTGSGAKRDHAGSQVVDTPAQLAAAVARFGLPVIVQRTEPSGRIYSVGGVYADGRLLANVVSRYIRTWPPHAGSASFSETVEPSPELLGRIERLLSWFGYEGLFEVELLHLDGGGFAVIDFNPRVYGSMAIAEAAGVNLPATWCDRLLERDVPSATQRLGVRYRFDDSELRNALWSLRRGRVFEALGILRPHRHVTHAYFRLSDPGPLFARVLELFGKGLRYRPRGQDGQAG